MYVVPFAQCRLEAESRHRVMAHCQSARQAGAGEPVAESPYYLRVLPAEPRPRKSLVTGAGRCRAVVGVEATFYVEARDDFGNRCMANATPCICTPSDHV